MLFQLRLVLVSSNPRRIPKFGTGNLSMRLYAREFSRIFLTRNFIRSRTNLAHRRSKHPAKESRASGDQERRNRLWHVFYVSCHSVLRRSYL